MQVRVKLHIESGNAAFGADETAARAEIAWILHSLADNLSNRGEYAMLRDSNGNRVGEAEISIHADDEESE